MMNLARLSKKSVFAVLLGTILAAFAMEVGLRLKGRDYPDVQAVLQKTRGLAAQPDFELDSRVGYLPKMDPRSRYSETGILKSGGAGGNAPVEKRVLFMGGSVSSDAKILRALASRYAGHGYEFLDAGVDGYNVVQSMKLYFRFNFREDAGQVVLILHNEDFYPTPTLFHAEQGTFYYVDGSAPVRVRPRLLEWSFLYRELLHRRLEKASSGAHPERWFALNTAEALDRLKTHFAARRIPLNVLILPPLRAPDRWSAREIQSHASALKTLDRLGIAYVDLMPVFRDSLQDGDPAASQEKLGNAIASFLKDRHFLDRDAKPSVRLVRR